jgi:hypothetical protein
MEQTATEPPVWRTRLRWWLRANTAGPAFAVATAADALLLAVLPFAGEGLDPAGAFLAAGFFNLFVVAAVAPAVGVLLRRRRAELPSFIARDRAATALMLALTAGLLAGGLLHRPERSEGARDRVAQAAAVRLYVRNQAPQYVAQLERADTVELGDRLFRTCVPSGDPSRALCLFVSTAQHPPGITRDPDARPNAVVSGPDNPGRRGG